MPTAPKATQHPYFHEEHGIKRPDPYHWLRNKESPAVLEHLQAENAYTESILAHHEPLKQALYQEILSRVQETDQDYPWLYGGYEYYFRTQAGLQHEIFCRRPKNSTTEDILFDENTHASLFEYFDVGQYALNIAQQKLAISIDTKGDERYDVWLLDADSKTLHEPRVRDVSGSIVFSANHRDLWYCRYDDTQRPYQVWCHDIEGEYPDILMYEEKDERFSVSIYRSMSDAYLIIHVSSKLTSESYFTSANTPRGDLTLFRARQPEHEYDIDHHGNYFYIRTNEDGANFALKRCATGNTASWETIVPLDPNTPLNGFSVFSDHMVLECRRQGLSQLSVMSMQDFSRYWIEFDEPAYNVHLGENWEFNTHLLRIDYTSMTTPSCDFLFDMNTRAKTLLKQSPVLGHFNAKDYTTDRIFATAKDGTLIPISLVYKTSLKKPHMPLLLNGYGAYGIDNDPYFSYSRLSLLNRGFIVAIAHVRGGGEFGDAWHEAGRFLHKKNTFTDFIACASHLIEQQYTSTKQLVITGGSAGGLLIGAVLNEAPALFGVAIAQVPFVDMLNTMMDDTLPLTVLEYEEWGNPHDKTYYEYMQSYAPYENIRPQAYPTVFTTAGLHDPRVPYWEAAKWIARLRDNQLGTAPLLLKVQMSAGHQGPSGRYHAIEEVAEEFAFILGYFSLK